MSGQHRGVQSIVKEACPNAHYVHCYAHQLNLVLQQATSQIDSVRVFFAHLNAFSIFLSHSVSMILKEMCDIVISHCSSRFEVAGHLVAATLFESGSFPNFEQCFPTKAVEIAATRFPFLDHTKLHSELSIIYSRPEFRQCCGAVPSLQLLIESNLAETFSETVLLLKAIITVSMTSCEAERCFSTLKRVKTFLRNTMSEDRLNATTMLSLEKSLTRDSINFNQNVIDMFPQLKNRRAKFLFK